MPATLISRDARRARARAEVVCREGAHVADDLAVGEMQANLAVANERRVRDHCEGRGRAVGKLKVHDLVVADVVWRLVHALAIWTSAQGLRDVLDVRQSVDQRRYRPTGFTARNSVQVDCG